MRFEDGVNWFCFHTKVAKQSARGDSVYFVCSQKNFGGVVLSAPESGYITPPTWSNPAWFLLRPVCNPAG